MNEIKLKKEITKFLEHLGAFTARIADPIKFAHAPKGCHPLDIMDDCRSVIVFAFNIGLDYYTALVYEHNNIRLGHLYRDWTSLQLITFLRKKGCNAIEVPREFIDEKNRIAPLSFKLAAYEAGIGVFGRPNIIITPEYGPRVNLGVVLTDAFLTPNGLMENFNPCEKCIVCVKVCPVNAIKSNMSPPTGFDRKRCIGFIDWLKEKTNERVKLCGYCFNLCPVGKVVKKTVRIKRWATLTELKAEDRIKLVTEFTKSIDI
jgi:epoxyqueuosine reductase QueG